MVFVEAPSRAAGFMNYKVPGSGRPLRKAGMRPEGRHYKRKEGREEPEALPLFPILCQLRGDEQRMSLAIHKQERFLARLANGLIEVSDVPDWLVVDFLDHITLP